MKIYKLEGYTTVGNDWNVISTLVFVAQDGSEYTADVSDANVTVAALQSWIDGELIQRAMPTLSADIREILISGILPEDWDAMFGDDVADTTPWRK